MPYGEKTADELIKIARKIFDFFETKNVKAIIMACNTTSAICYDTLKDEYGFKIYPVIQSVSKVLSDLDTENIGVFATPATVNSHAYSKNIAGKNVFEVACPDWVKIVEKNEIATPDSVKKVKSKVDEMLKFNPEKIVLGCTHYPYLSDIIGQFYNKQNLINPAKYFAEFIRDDLSGHGMLNINGKGSEEFYVSSNPEKFVLSAKLFYELSECPTLIKL